MRLRSYLKGHELQGMVCRFANDFRDAGKLKAVKFDGEFLRTAKVENATDPEALIGVYDPKAPGFDLEIMVADIFAAMDEMGVRVEHERD